MKLGQSTPYVKMCVIAGTGFGKTVFAASAPNALFLLSDPEGAESAASLGIGTDNDEWPIRHWDTGDNSLQTAYEYMVQEGCDKYDWLVHDNATVENKLAMARAMEVSKAVKEGKQSPFIPDKPQYQFSQNAFLAMTGMFLDLPINQIWLARPRVMTVENPETMEAEEVITADIQNDGIAENFLGMMKIIGVGVVRRREDDSESRRLYFSHRGMFRGKDRTNALGPYRDNLDVPRMMRLIEAKRAGKVSRPAKKTAAARRRRTNA